MNRKPSEAIILDSPAVAQACTFLSALLTKSEDQGIEQLPPLRSLAAACGVSLKTIWRAAHLLEERGRLKAIHGKGLVSSKLYRRRAISALNTNFGQTARPQKWESVADAMREDLLQGRLVQQGAFPRLKLLQARYRVSFRTLRHALKQLTDENTLVLTAGRYHLPAVTAPFSNSTIVLVGHGNAPGAPNRETPQSEPFLQTLEQELSQRNIRLRLLTYNDYRPSGEFLLDEGSRPAPPFDDWVLGYIVWTVNVIDIPQYLQKLALHKKPMAILPQNKSIVIPDSVRNNSLNKVFTFGSTIRCSQTVGQYLMRLGHKHVAYISPFHGAQWSQVRYEGLQKTFVAAGYTVRLFGVPDVGSPYDYRRSITESYYDEKIEEIRNILQPTMAGLETGELGSLRRVLMKTAADHFTSLQLGRLLEQALSREEITAWVCADDSVAIAALDFLKKRGVSVPRQISVIGFNDTFEAFQQSVTSYNFNVPALVSAMVRHVTFPDYKPLHKQNPSIELDGMIVERKSTGRAPTETAAPVARPVARALTA